MAKNLVVLKKANKESKGKIIYTEGGGDCSFINYHQKPINMKSNPPKECNRCGTDLVRNYCYQCEAENISKKELKKMKSRV